MLISPSMWTLYLVTSEGRSHFLSLSQMNQGTHELDASSENFQPTNLARLGVKGK